MTTHPINTQWIDGETSVSFAAAPFEGRLQLSEGLGYTDLRCGQARFDGELWKLFTSPGAPLTPPCEQYIRGDDCVTTHPPTDEFPFRTKLYWSTQGFAEDALLLTLTVSLQTDLLDSHPRISLISQFRGEAETVVESSQDPTGRWIGGATPSLRCFECVHPLDLGEFTASAEAASTTLELAPPFLEKGVIRSCRVAAILLAPGAEADVLRSAYEAFTTAAPPLTA